MNELFKQGAKFFFIGMAILIVGWTGYHTFSVLKAATGDPIQAVYGLLVFEGSALIWFALFLRNAESIGQHLVALFGTVAGVALVLVAFFMSMQVDPSEIAKYGSSGRWMIVIATAEVLVFVFLYELFNPKVWEELNDMIHDAMLHAKADKKAALMIEKESDELANVLAQNRKDRVFARARISGIKPIPQQSGAQQQQRPPMPQMPQVRPANMEVELPKIVPNGDGKRPT